MSVDISVVIVNWNTRDVLLACLRSINKQDAAICREVIVVDNGSTDGSVDAIKRNCPEVIVIANSSNLGFAKANNLGMSICKGRYICLVNSDVEMLDGCLVSLLEFMNKHAVVGIAGPKILYPDFTVQNSCRKFPTLWNNLSPAIGLDKLFWNATFFSGEHMTYFKHDKLLFSDYLAGCVLFVRRKALDEVGLLDERFFIYQEEVDWCKRFRQNGWRVAFFPGAAAIHHHGASSSKDPKRFALAQQRSLLQYWEKHHNRLTVVGIRLILMLKHILRIIPRLFLYCIVINRRQKIGQKLEMHLACLSILFRTNRSA